MLLEMIVGCQSALWELVEKSHCAHVGVEDHFLGAGPFGDDCNRTLKLLLCDSFVVVTAVKRQVISEECHFHRVRHNEE